MSNEEKKFIVKKHLSNRKLILAVCDPHILGKKFEEKNLQLDLTSNFYKGDEMSEEELAQVIKKAYIINVVGNKSINFFIQRVIIKKENINTISNIPHTQIFTGQET